MNIHNIYINLVTCLVTIIVTVSFSEVTPPESIQTHVAPHGVFFRSGVNWVIGSPGASPKRLNSVGMVTSIKPGEKQRIS